MLGNEKGITLVALIMVMVILIVLAGMSIALVVSERNSVEAPVLHQNPSTNVEVDVDEEPEVTNEVVETESTEDVEVPTTESGEQV